MEQNAADLFAELPNANSTITEQNLLVFVLVMVIITE